MAKLRGHDVRVHPTDSGARFVAECSCGYRSATRTNEDLAVAAALHHCAKIVAERRRNGQPIGLSRTA